MGAFSKRERQIRWLHDGKTVKQEDGVQLSVIVVGAGIAGFAAALALRRAGHKVKIIEQSRFKREAGLMIVIGPNGAKVLNKFGFDFKRARAVPCDYVRQHHSKTLNIQTEIDSREQPQVYGSPTWLIYRPDLHTELMRLALDPDSEYAVPELVLGSKVTLVDPENGIVTLGDGSVHTADIIIGADGERSAVRHSFKYPGNLREHPFKMIRTLIPTDDILADPELIDFMQSKRRAFSMMNSGIRVLTIYEGRDGTLQDFELAYLIKPDGSNLPLLTDKPLLRERLLEEAKDFHPFLGKMLAKAQLENISDWNVYTLDPLPTWHQSRALVIGDASHSMFFTTGQGGNQALEDAGALYVLFNRSNLPSVSTQNTSSGQELNALISERFTLFEKIRKERAQLMQRLSPILLGKEASYFKKVDPDLKVKGVPIKTTKQHLDLMYDYDVFVESKKVLEGEDTFRAHL